MIPLQLRLSQVQFSLFAGFALAAVQNVTVDDAILAGIVVPQYLPAASDWNIGNDCASCFVKPNPSLAYNGTWHDCTYSPSNSYTQEIEFTFTGSAVYIFFILANYVPNATTSTDVQFIMDEIFVGTYTHAASSSTDYEYNVAVYANSSVPLGEHSMRIQPVNSGNNLLILFDYLVYTSVTDDSTSELPTTTTTFILPQASTTPLSLTSLLSPSQTSTPLPSPTRLNIGAVVGGVVGGVTAFSFVAMFLLYCYRKRHVSKYSADGPAGVDPFILSGEVPPTPLVTETPSISTQPNPPMATLSTTDTGPRNLKTGVQTSVAPQTTITLASVPPTSSTPPSSSAPPSSNGALYEQVELLRDEVARLRDLRGSEPNTFELEREAPPEYS